MRGGGLYLEFYGIYLEPCYICAVRYVFVSLFHGDLFYLFLYWIRMVGSFYFKFSIITNIIVIKIFSFFTIESIAKIASLFCISFLVKLVGSAISYVLNYALLVIEVLMAFGRYGFWFARTDFFFSGSRLSSIPLV